MSQNIFKKNNVSSGKIGLILVAIVVVVLAGVLFTSQEGVKPSKIEENAKELAKLPVSKLTGETISTATSCNIKSLTKNPVAGVKIFSPDGKKYVLNKEDQNGVGQIYLGNTGKDDLRCITCSQSVGGPKPDRYKTQASWHPSGKWIFFASERDQYSKPPILGESREFVEGMIRSGLFINLWATDLNAEKWYQMTDFVDPKWGETKPNGLTGPIFSPNGKKAVWSQIVDGNVLTYSPFGRWELMLMDFDDTNGAPRLTNSKNITPPKMYWNEPGNFGPDNNIFIFSGSDLKDQQGMDQYLFNLKTNKITNLTNTPTIWDEHGRLSPDGKKVIFMSAYPYRNIENSSTVLGIKTDFMMMNSDGSNLKQLTHFLAPGYPESSQGIAASPEWKADGKSAQLRQLFFPDYADWTLTFEGACGKQ